jgi:hypothetical protein
MTHKLTKLPQLKDNKSHVKHILLYMCQICLIIFLTHDVPNTPQVKPTKDNCEAYLTQHVSNVTLCRCQIYSADIVIVCTVKNTVSAKENCIFYVQKMITMLLSNIRDLS